MDPVRTYGLPDTPARATAPAALAFPAISLGRVARGVATGGLSEVTRGLLGSGSPAVPAPQPLSAREQQIRDDSYADYQTGRNLRGAGRRGLTSAFLGQGEISPEEFAKLTPEEQMNYRLSRELGSRTKAGLEGSLAVNPALMKAFQRRRQQIIEEGLRRGQHQTGTVQRDRLDKFGLEQSIAEEYAKHGLLSAVDAADIAGTSGTAMRAAANPQGLTEALRTPYERGPSQAGLYVAGVDAAERGRGDEYNAARYNADVQRRNQRAGMLSELLRMGGTAVGFMAGGPAGAAAGGAAGGAVGGAAGGGMPTGDEWAAMYNDPSRVPQGGFLRRGSF